MRLVLSEKMWHKIPDHDEEVFVHVDHDLTTRSYRDAYKACAMKNSIMLVLWKLPVLKFMTNYILDYYKVYTAFTGTGI